MTTCKTDKNGRVSEVQFGLDPKDMRQALPGMIARLNAEQMIYVISHLIEALSESDHKPVQLVRQ